jgi:hypothetical protein
LPHLTPTFRLGRITRKPFDTDFIKNLLKFTEFAGSSKIKTSLVFAEESTNSVQGVEINNFHEIKLDSE